MKVVIDTSVWISALIEKNSKARDIFRLVFNQKIYPQISEALFREYESVMNREKIQKLISLDKNEQMELFQAFLSMCRWNDIYYIWRPNLKDENDNFLVELAVASGAEAIITYNTKDFKNSQLIFNHKIITPENLIKELL
jgi:putative PIN family toxin of toxin-antitoxin system